MPKVLLFSRQPLNERPLHEWLDETKDSVVLITTSEAVTGMEAVLAKQFPQHCLVEDYKSWATERVADAAARRYGVDLVASTSEQDVLRAARLRGRLGLPGQDSKSAVAFRDKVIMKQLAGGVGIPVPAFSPVDDTMDLLDFLDAHGYPAVVKPRTGAAAEGVSMLYSEVDLNTFLTFAQDSGPSHVPGRWMVEEFVRGDFFHVDGIMHDGKVLHAWPSEYSGGIAEHVRDQSCLSSILLAPDNERTAKLLRLTVDVIGALPGSPLPLAFHLEAWIGSDGQPVLCEVACRAGGGLIAHTYERAFGVQLAKEGLRAQCGYGLTLCEQPQAPGPACGWVIFPPGRGTFVPPADPCPVPGVDLTLHLKAGTERQGMKHAAESAAGAIVTAQTAGGVRDRLNNVVDWWLHKPTWV